MKIQNIMAELIHKPKYNSWIIYEQSCNIEMWKQGSFFQLVDLLWQTGGLSLTKRTTQFKTKVGQHENIYTVKYTINERTFSNCKEKYEMKCLLISNL